MKTNNIASALAVVIVLTAISISSSFAQQTLNPPVQFGVNPPQGVYVIRGARIVPVSSPVIENGSVLIRNGKIEAVGATVTAPANAQVINGRGLSVYPGMIDLGTAMGLVEIPQGAAGTVDTAEVGEVNPNAAAIIAISPYSAHIAVTRVNGITAVLSSPGGGLISGQSALINLVGTTPSEMAIVPTAALAINFPTVAAGGRGGGGGFFGQQQAGNIADAITARDRQLDGLRKWFRDAESYGRAQDAYAKDKSLPRPDSNLVLAAIVPYARGERPVILRAERERDIRAAVMFAEEMKLKAIVMGGAEAWKVASLLKQKNVPVIISSVLDSPRGDDEGYDVLYENAAKLQQAGVKFCISTGDAGAEVRDTPYHAGMAASFGLSRDEALKSVTLYPAEIMGVGNRLGSIEVGKIANLVITDGDLLEARTNVKQVFIDGRMIPMTSRHTELFDAFKNRK
jgi:imidazolonepropionase-like amidohydrolase